MRVLESGEHLIQVVGVNGVTHSALSHTFIDALIAEIEKITPPQAPGAVSYDPQAPLELVAPVESNPVPTDAQIAAYLARQSESSDATRKSTVIDAATGAPQGTFQATA